MPRLMSVALTKAAVVSRRKRVTRRAGWSFLTPDTVLELCGKVMGRRPGEPLERLCRVRVVSVRQEPLNAITDADVALEGFTVLDWIKDPVHGDRPFVGTPREWFVSFFTHHMGGAVDQTVTRIEWEYLDA